MAKFPTEEEFAKRLAERALDEYLYQGKSIREWIKTISEQQPCEDCISREAVIKHICETKECYKDVCKGRLHKRCMDLQWVYDLPPVTPQPKTGELTNGDMMKIIFPDVEVETVKVGGQIVGYDISKLDKGSCAETYFTKTWWNAPYFVESEETK